MLYLRIMDNKVIPTQQEFQIKVSLLPKLLAWMDTVIQTEGTFSQASILVRKQTAFEGLLKDLHAKPEDPVTPEHKEKVSELNEIITEIKNEPELLNDVLFKTVQKEYPNFLNFDTQQEEQTSTPEHKTPEQKPSRPIQNPETIGSQKDTSGSHYLGVLETPLRAALRTDNVRDPYAWRKVELLRRAFMKASGGYQPRTSKQESKQLPVDKAAQALGFENSSSIYSVCYKMQSEKITKKHIKTAIKILGGDPEAWSSAYITPPQKFSQIQINEQLKKDFESLKEFIKENEIREVPQFYDKAPTEIYKNLETKKNTAPASETQATTKRKSRDLSDTKQYLKGLETATRASTEGVNAKYLQDPYAFRKIELVKRAYFQATGRNPATSKAEMEPYPKMEATAKDWGYESTSILYSRCYSMRSDLLAEGNVNKAIEALGGDPKEWDKVLNPAPTGQTFTQKQMVEQIQKDYIALATYINNHQIRDVKDLFKVSPEDIYGKPAEKERPKQAAAELAPSVSRTPDIKQKVEIPKPSTPVRKAPRFIKTEFAGRPSFFKISSSLSKPYPITTTLAEYVHKSLQNYSSGKNSYNSLAHKQLVLYAWHRKLEELGDRGNHEITLGGHTPLHQQAAQDLGFEDESDLFSSMVQYGSKKLTKAQIDCIAAYMEVEVDQEGTNLPVDEFKHQMIRDLNYLKNRTRTKKNERSSTNGSYPINQGLLVTDLKLDPEQRILAIRILESLDSKIEDSAGRNASQGSFNNGLATELDTVFISKKSTEDKRNITRSQTTNLPLHEPLHRSIVLLALMQADPNFDADYLNPNKTASAPELENLRNLGFATKSAFIDAMNNRNGKYIDFEIAQKAAERTKSNLCDDFNLLIPDTTALKSSWSKEDKAIRHTLALRA